MDLFYPIFSGALHPSRLAELLFTNNTQSETSEKLGLSTTNGLLLPWQDSATGSVSVRKMDSF